MIEMRDAMRAVVKHRKGDIVLPTETSIRAWADVTDDQTLDLPIPAMGKGSSMALGVALAQPDRRVIVWDGDGSILMNLGSLVTVAGMAPRNLYHIILDNAMYAMTGGQPVPNAGSVSYPDLAQAAGYAKAFAFDNLEDWTMSIGDVLNEPGPVLIVMKTAPEITDWKHNPPKHSRRMPEAAPVARAALMGQSKAPRARLSRAEVYDLAALASLKLDDTRADTIALRLGAVLEELETIPGETLTDVEPLPTFATEGD